MAGRGMSLVRMGDRINRPRPVSIEGVVMADGEERNLEWTVILIVVMVFLLIVMCTGVVVQVFNRPG